MAISEFNISDTGNDFSSIIRGLLIIQHYSTFRKIVMHGRTESCTMENQVCFIQSHFYSDAEHSSKTFISVEVSTAHSLKHHCTANTEVFLMQHRTLNEYWEW